MMNKQTLKGWIPLFMLVLLLAGSFFLIGSVIHHVNENEEERSACWEMSREAYEGFAHSPYAQIENQRNTLVVCGPVKVTRGHQRVEVLRCYEMVTPCEDAR